MKKALSFLSIMAALSFGGTSKAQTQLVMESTDCPAGKWACSTICCPDDSPGCYSDEQKQVICIKPCVANNTCQGGLECVGGFCYPKAGSEKKLIKQRGYIPDPQQ
ncbi:MAG: hypothetical protein JSR85_08090 [Proteobacteria bacterium]|nr:hypothetical protein [Pseudomonadota bacterium]